MRALYLICGHSSLKNWCVRYVTPLYVASVSCFGAKLSTIDIKLTGTRNVSLSVQCHIDITWDLDIRRYVHVTNEL